MTRPQRTATKGKPPALPPDAYDRIPRAQLTVTDETLWLTRFDKRGKACATYPVTVNDAARAFHDLGRVSSGLLPPDILFWQAGAGRARVGLWLPPARREILWARGKRDLRLAVPMPGLVFVGRGKRYWVWAAAARPARGDERLLRAPLSNVGPDGLICSGNVQFPLCSPDTIHQAAAAFFESRFNADLSADRVAGAENLLGFLRGLKGKRAFPAERLIAANLSLAALLKDDAQESEADRWLEHENEVTDPLGVIGDEDDDEPDFMGDGEEYRDEMAAEQAELMV